MDEEALVGANQARENTRGGAIWLRDIVIVAWRHLSGQHVPHS